MGFPHVGQAGLEFPNSGDPAASVSQSAGIIGVRHCEVGTDLMKDFTLCQAQLQGGQMGPDRGLWQGLRWDDQSRTVCTVEAGALESSGPRQFPGDPGRLALMPSQNLVQSQSKGMTLLAGTWP